MCLTLLFERKEVHFRGEEEEEKKLSFVSTHLNRRLGKTRLARCMVSFCGVVFLYRSLTMRSRKVSSSQREEPHEPDLSRVAVCFVER